MAEQAPRLQHEPTLDELPAVPATVAVVRARCVAAAAALGASEARLADVAIAVGEAAANVVRHAYGAGSPGLLLLDVHSDGPGRLRVVVADDGAGLAGSGSTPGMGRGLVLMETLSDELRIISTKDLGTSVTLTFILGA
jgi:anti-sigma regulatory factor (Ser/Thr protein kinase)